MTLPSMEKLKTQIHTQCKRGQKILCDQGELLEPLLYQFD